MKQQTINEQDSDIVKCLKKIENHRNQDFMTWLNSEHRRMRVKPPMKKGQRVRASEIYEFCPRREVLKILENITIREEQTDNTTRIFTVGRNYERFIRDSVLGNRGVLIGKWQCTCCGHIPAQMDGAPRYPKPGNCPQCQSLTARANYEENRYKYDGVEKDLWRFIEEDLYDEHSGVGGHNDGFLYWMRNYHVFEAKTTNDRRFRWAKKIGGYEEHKAQVQVYMRLSGYKSAIIIYFNKNDGSQFAVFVPYEPSHAGFLLNKGYQMQEFWKKKIIPDRRMCINKGCSRAQGCPVAELCFSDEHPPTKEYWTTLS